MASGRAVFYSASGTQLQTVAAEWIAAHEFPVVKCAAVDELMALALRGRPAVALFDARTEAASALRACRRLKEDSYSGVVPAAVLVSEDSRELLAAFEAGADEVIPASMAARDAHMRLDVMLRRAERDVRVHPSTRLPGAPEIEAEIGRRLMLGLQFAACYADLDHFKEYNDRYGYYEGDRVIRMLARVLHDVVRGLSPEDGFVGHIGGDDFLFIVPVPVATEICAEIVSIFDVLVPYQYSEQDRLASYFFGKDRRGQLHRVPLMTVSIGIVTNERRTFTHPAQVSELATEMKSYAKTLPGSVYVVDRRNEAMKEAPLGAAQR